MRLLGAVLLGLALAVGAGCAARQGAGRVGPTATTVLPARVCRDTFVVDVMVNGAGPYAMVIDTGCGAVVVSPRVARELPHDVVASNVKLHSSSGSWIDAPQGLNVRELSVSGVRLAGGRAVVHDMAGTGQAMRMEIDGLLGFPAFREVLLTLDHPAREVRLARGTLGGLPGCTPYTLDPGGVPLAALRLPGREVRAIVDSGSGSSIALNEAVVQGLGTKSGWRETGASISADAVQVMFQARLDGPAMCCGISMDDPIIERTGGSSHVGVGIMKHFSWTFDQRAGLVRIEGDRASPLRMEPVRGIGAAVKPGRDAFPVIAVFPGGPAEEAGLRVGDLIAAVNDEAAGSLECGRWQELTLGGESVRLDIQRGESRLRVTIRLVELVP